MHARAMAGVGPLGDVTPPRASTPRSMVLPHTGFSASQVTPPPPGVRERSPTAAAAGDAEAPPFKAMRPPERDPRILPGSGVMTIEELSQSIHNIMAQMANEKQHVDQIAGAVTEHANNLESAEGIVNQIRRDMRSENEARMAQKKYDAEQLYNNMTVDIANLYERITQERVEAIQHSVESVNVDSRVV